MGSAGRLTGDELNSSAVWRRILFARDRFAENAAITLYGCNSGSDQSFLDDFSRSFGVAVHGFSTGLYWCIASDAAEKVVVSRGLTRIGAPTKGGSSGCLGFQSDIRWLKPDVHSSVGVPKRGARKTSVEDVAFATLHPLVAVKAAHAAAAALLESALKQDRTRGCRFTKDIELAVIDQPVLWIRNYDFTLG